MKYFLIFFAIAMTILVLYEPEETFEGFNWIFWLVFLSIFVFPSVEAYRGQNNQKQPENNIENNKSQPNKKTES